MMILSRAWYLVLAVVAAASFYVVSLAVGQYNRQVTSSADEELKSDSQVVGWALQIDARRRLDNLSLGAADENVRKALKAANGKEAIAPSAREDGKKGLASVNEKFPVEYKFSAMFVVDREGRVVAQNGYDSANASPDFELGGFPAVFDALHGYLRDDNWVLDTRLFRVVTRPVEDEVGQPPLGAVVGLTAVDTEYGRELAKRTRSNVAFFAGGARVAQGAGEGFQASAFDELTSEFSRTVQEATFKSSGRSDVRSLGPKKTVSVVFSRLHGDAGEVGAGFAVVRQRALLAGMMGFISGADDQDKKNVNYIVILGILLLGAGLGIAFSVLEHTLPLKAFRKQSEEIQAGKRDAFQLAGLGGAFRPVAQNINGGVERIVEKGGGMARKPADLAAILGPVPAQPQMSAFAFPLPEHSASSAGTPHGSGPVLPGSASGPSLPSGSSGARIVPPAPRPPPAPHGAPHVPPSAPKPPPPKAATLQMPPELAKASAIPNLAPPAEAYDDDPDEATRMGAAPGHVLRAATGSDAPRGATPQGNEGGAGDPVEWQGVFDDFVRTKKQCGEVTDGLTYSKFRGTLLKNRDALIQRHQCARVKFAVYVKDGRASLKATPVRDV